MNYQDMNAQITDKWCDDGWIWGKPISHETYLKALKGDYEVYLTPTKPVPHAWLNDLKGKKILGLASGGGQQLPIFSALKAECTLLDYSQRQCLSEKAVAEREGYTIEIINGDMTKPLPFKDESFDLIFHPVSNCYVKEVEPIFKECYRILKRGGVLLGGYDLEFHYIFDDNDNIVYHLPFDPTINPEQYADSLKNDWGITFSHSLEEQIGGQLKAGFRIVDLYDDTGGSGTLHDHNVATFIAVKSIKE